MIIFRPKELQVVIEALSHHVVQVFKEKGAHSRETMLVRTTLDRAKRFQERISRPKGMGTPSQIRKQIQSRQRVLNMILRGLDGDRFSWGSGEFDSYRVLAEGMGFTLLTKTAGERRGYTLKRGAEPVGYAYFNAPIQQSHAIYVLECHFKPKERK